MYLLNTKPKSMNAIPRGDLDGLGAAVEDVGSEGTAEE